MSLTIRDAEDSLAAASAKIKDWQDEFLRMWEAPRANTIMATWWQRGIPPAVKAKLTVMQPDAVSKVDAQYGKVRKT